MREIKFRAWLFNKMIKPMSIQKMVHQRKSNIPLRILENECVFMQYTGLKDKNKVEIYEGDIINHNDFIGYVKYINKGNCNVLGYALVSLLNNRVFYMYCDETDNYEVIGNIYENPELLEEKLND